MSWLQVFCRVAPARRGSWSRPQPPPRAGRGETWGARRARACNREALLAFLTKLQSLREIAKTCHQVIAWDVLSEVAPP